MRKNILFMTVFYAMLVLFNGCDSFVKTIEETKSGATRNENITSGEKSNALNAESQNGHSAPIDTPNHGFLMDTSALLRAEKALRNRPELRGKEVFIYMSIHFYDDYRIYLKIQNPDNPEYVDSYHYDKGGWSDPKPVVLSKRDIVSKNIVNINELPFQNAHRVSRIIQDKLIEIESKSKDYNVYAITSNNKISWYPRSLTSDRSRYTIEFNADGSLKSFDQD
ncbi:hypothetical protein [Sphingobacterium deserti]|nr:hypothetical protein [Sphingobacterium deserti]